MKLARYATMVTVATLALLPLYWLLVFSLRPAGDIFRFGGHFSWRTLIPSTLDA